MSEEKKNNQEGTSQEEKDTQEKKFDINEILENPEFQKFLQSYTDKRVTQAVQKRDAEWQKKLEEERKKATMTKEELIAEKEKELQEFEKQLKLKELELNKINYFKEKNIPLEFTEFVSGNDVEEIKQKADALLQIFNQTLERKIEERFKNSGYEPNDNGDTATVFTREQIAKMTPEEYAKNRDKINKLIAQGLIK